MQHTADRRLTEPENKDEDYVSYPGQIYEPSECVTGSSTRVRFMNLSLNLVLVRPYMKDFPGGSDGKASAYNAGDPGLIPGLGRSSGEGNGNPLQYLCLEKSHGQRSLIGCSPWGRKESDTTECLHLDYTCLHSVDFFFLSMSLSNDDSKICILGLP